MWDLNTLEIVGVQQHVVQSTVGEQPEPSAYLTHLQLTGIDLHSEMNLRVAYKTHQGEHSGPQPRRPAEIHESERSEGKVNGSSGESHVALKQAVKHIR